MAKVVERLSEFLKAEVSGWGADDYIRQIHEEGWEIAGWTERYPKGSVRITAIRYLNGGMVDAVADGVGDGHIEAFQNLLHSILFQRQR